MAKHYAATKNKLLHCGRCCTALFVAEPLNETLASRLREGCETSGTQYIVMSNATFGRVISVAALLMYAPIKRSNKVASVLA